MIIPFAVSKKKRNDRGRGKQAVNEIVTVTAAGVPKECQGTCAFTAAATFLSLSTARPYTRRRRRAGN
jgi:hypothetical protein